MQRYIRCKSRPPLRWPTANQPENGLYRRSPLAPPRLDSTGSRRPSLSPLRCAALQSPSKPKISQHLRSPHCQGLLFSFFNHPRSLPTDNIARLTLPQFLQRPASINTAATARGCAHLASIDSIDARRTHPLDRFIYRYGSQATKRMPTLL